MVVKDEKIRFRRDENARNQNGWLWRDPHYC
jgi:hypothetical protein